MIRKPKFVRLLNCRYIFCLKTFRSFTHGKRNLVTFNKFFKPITNDVSEVNKQIITIILRNETETFSFIKPLYCTNYLIRHIMPLIKIKIKVH
ncbi:hypothetical protein BOO92_00530 [Vibrio navarrensis]|nr:hypothetical protein [Vibrio navarrensis]MBE3669128.1 hypothetical protein [Vibrio navarrensis]